MNLMAILSYLIHSYPSTSALPFFRRGATGLWSELFDTWRYQGHKRVDVQSHGPGQERRGHPARCRHLRQSRDQYSTVWLHVVVSWVFHLSAREVSTARRRNSRPRRRFCQGMTKFERVVEHIVASFIVRTVCMTMLSFLLNLKLPERAHA